MRHESAPIYAVAASVLVAGAVSVAMPRGGPRAQPGYVALPAASMRVCFSPRGGCTDEVVGVIRSATKSVDVLAYSFTSGPIAKALADAAARGVHVRVVLDKSQPSAQGNQIAVLRAAKIPVWIDHAHAIAHNKVVLVDGRLVETGSFNFTTAAEDSNAENALVIDDPQLEAIYAAEFDRHVAHSEAFP